jgi:hypothetical protein
VVDGSSSHSLAGGCSWCSAMPVQGGDELRRRSARRGEAALTVETRSAHGIDVPSDLRHAGLGGSEEVDRLDPAAAHFLD